MPSLKYIFNLLALLLSLIYFSFGCSKAPHEELNSAKAAVEAARDMEADKYLANNFQNLLKALEAAEKEIAKQKKTFFVSRKYSGAKQLLRKTTDLALELKNEAPRAKKEMADVVEENLPIVRDLLKLTDNNIKKASRFKSRQIIAALKSDLSSAESITDSAVADFEAGNIFKASRRLDTVQITVTKITDILLNADSRTVQFDEAKIQ